MAISPRGGVNIRLILPDGSERILPLRSRF